MGDLLPPMMHNPPRPDLMPARRVGAVGPSFLSRVVGGGKPIRYRRVRCLACNGTGRDLRRAASCRGNPCPWPDCDGGTCVVLELAPKEGA